MIVGLVAIPVLLAKLWSVIPRLFAWPPVARPARRSSGCRRAARRRRVFQLATGVSTSQNWYPFHFNFVVAHYYGALVFLGALALHVVVKLPIVRRAYRERGVLKPLRDDLAHTRARARRRPGRRRPARRRSPAAACSGSSARLGRLSWSPPASRSAGRCATRVLAPRGLGDGDFPVNKTASLAGVTPAMTGFGLAAGAHGGAATRRLDRARAAGDAAAHGDLPIACVEGWSTTQALDRRAARATRRAGRRAAARHGCSSSRCSRAARFAQTTLSADQVADGRSLLALEVNGADLSLDHGYPARIIVPALPGVHNTKWVGGHDLPGGVMRVPRATAPPRCTCSATSRPSRSRTTRCSELLLSRYAQWVNWVAWFVGGALLHDLVFLPIYVLARLRQPDRPPGQPAAPGPRRELRARPGGHVGDDVARLLPAHPRQGRAQLRRRHGRRAARLPARWLLVTASSSRAPRWPTPSACSARRRRARRGRDGIAGEGRTPVQPPRRSVRRADDHAMGRTVRDLLAYWPAGFAGVLLARPPRRS